MFILLTPVWLVLALITGIMHLFRNWKDIWLNFLVSYGLRSSCHKAKFYWPSDVFDQDVGEDRCGVCHQRREDIGSEALIKNLGKQI